jgi:predicted solute-binding protein
MVTNISLKDLDDGHRKVYDQHKSYVVSKLQKKFDLTRNEALDYFKLLNYGDMVRQRSWADFVDKHYGASRIPLDKWYDNI